MGEVGIVYMKGSLLQNMQRGYYDEDIMSFSIPPRVSLPSGRYSEIIIYFAILDIS